MANKPGEINPLLRRPLYVFDLPPEILHSLTLKSAAGPHQHIPDETPPTHDSSRQVPAEDGIPTSTSCNLCKVSFPNVQDQRQHVKSDFHRYNLKLSVKGLPTIDESTFIRMIGDLDESISGSDSSESDGEDDVSSGKDATLSALLKHQAKLSQDNDEAVNIGPKKSVPGNAPILWLSSPKIGDENVLGVYRAILSKEEQEEASQSLVDILKAKQLKPIQAKSSRNVQTNGTQTPAVADPHYFLCMVGGGHFAAMIVSLIPEIRKGPGGIEERQAVVRAHKTFHRYTTRRKQGGSQSANDNAKGNAHSAGSSIRRYNEAALEADIRNVLSEWRSMIDSAELLFIRATGTTNRRTLYGPYDGQVLRSNDRRIRGFPFSTRRATQAELLRSFQELTRLKVAKVVGAVPEPAPRTESPTPKPSKAKPTPPKLSKEEETAALHTTQLQALIRRSKAPGVLLYLTKNDISPNFSFCPATEHHHAPTPLHLSASTNSPALVTALLLKAHADPTIQNTQGKTPYDIAGDTQTRNAFRVARHTLGEDAFDWSAAHVPPGISQEESDAKSKQDQLASDEAEAERRKADLEKLNQDEERRNVGRIERKAGTGKSLAGGGPAVAEKTAAEKREEEMRGLTPEMRMRIERERRARAAEERLRKTQAK